MSISAKIDETKKTIIISVNGHFNFSSHPDFRSSYRDFEKKTYAATVDLKNTESLDSAALGMLLLLHEGFSSQPVQIVNPNKIIAQVLEIAHFDTIFIIK